MNYYLDTEFIEGQQSLRLFGPTTFPTIDLISIGIVSQDGREYYAVSKTLQKNKRDLELRITRMAKAGKKNSGYGKRAQTDMESLLQKKL
jgi:hypothetical protein